MKSKEKIERSVKFSRVYLQPFVKRVSLKSDYSALTWPATLLFFIITLGLTSAIQANRNSYRHD